MYHIIKFFFVYPQYIFVKHILKILNKHVKKDANFIDVPCGNGIISYWLSKDFTESKFSLYDIDKSLIDKFNDINTNKNIVAKQRNISNVEIVNDNSCNVLLLINSLYLLTDYGNIINKLSGVDYIVGVFPDIEAKNYNCFLNTDYANHLEINAMSITETNDFFKKHKYELLEGYKIISYHFFCMSFEKIVRRILNFIDFSNKDDNGAYYIAIYKRNDNV